MNESRKENEFAGKNTLHTDMAIVMLISNKKDIGQVNVVDITLGQVYWLGQNLKVVPA